MPVMTIRVRRATADDATAIAGLLAELGYPPPSVAAVAPRLARLVDERQVVMLAVQDGRVVGLATMFVRHVIVDEAPFARLAALVVAADRRGQGVGRALVSAVEELAIEAGCSAMEVTSGDHRPAAHSFYRSLGFEERPRRFVKRLSR